MNHLVRLSWHCSNSGKLGSKQKPTDLKFVNHSITGKVVIVTPRLIVTKTSPTPTEETVDGKMPLPITHETNSDQTGLKVAFSQCGNLWFFPIIWDINFDSTSVIFNSIHSKCA